MKNWGVKATTQLNKLTNEMVAGSGGKLKNKIASNLSSKVKPVSVGQKVKSGLNKAYRPDLGKAIPAKGVIVKSMGKSFLVTTALCSALGLNGATCTEKIESGEVTPEQIKQAEKEIQDQLEQNINVDDLEFEL